jgi:uncharacterized CHY-type Zn-finger protein
MEQLPPVAKNTYYPCSKCDAERYHRVLAHLSASEARIECEVCGSKKKLKIGAKKMAKKASTSSTKSTRAQNAHVEAWTELKEKYSDLPPELYSIKGSYRTNSLIDHPSFGIGVVTESLPNKIEVCFEEGVKSLIHRRN